MRLGDDDLKKKSSFRSRVVAPVAIHGVLRDEYERIGRMIQLHQAEIEKLRSWASMDDPMTEATKFLKASGSGEVFEAEFLVGMRGKGTDSIFPVRSLSIKGQSMRELNMLVESPLEVDYRGWPLRVPSPEQYVFHKILINPLRT